MFVRSPMRYTMAVAVLIVALLSAASVPSMMSAQAGSSNQCSQVMSLVQKNLSSSCASLNKGEACYGNAPITVQYQDPAKASDLPFAKTGDIVGIDSLKSLVMGPLKVDTGEWGVAVLRVQADSLPGTTAGQAVTFLLFGDVSLSEVQGPDQGSLPPPVTATCTGTTTRNTFLRNAPGPNEQQLQLVTGGTSINVLRRVADGSWVFVEDKGKVGWMLGRYVQLGCKLDDLTVDDPSKPITLPRIHSFYFTTGVSANAACQDVPTGGMLIQSPSGHRVTLNINGVEMTIGSTVLFTASNNKLAVFVLDGHLIVTLDGKQYTFGTGQGASLGDGSVRREFMATMFQTFGTGDAVAILRTIVQLMQALNLDVPSDTLALLNPPSGNQGGGNGNGQNNSPATPLVCTERTFLSNGMVCIPNYGTFPCNRDGICNNGEITYTCPEDCGNPLPPDGLGGKQPTPYYNPYSDGF